MPERKPFTQLDSLKLHDVLSVPMPSQETAQRYRHAIRRLKDTKGKEFSQKSTAPDQTIIVRTK